MIANPFLARPTARRLLLLTPAALVACASPPPRVEGPAIGYRHLTPIRLDVAQVDIDERTPNAGPNDVGRELTPSAAEAVRIMGRDRVTAFGSQHRARFVVVRAQILRVRNPRSGGYFASDAGERLDCTLTARLEILGENDQRLGFAEASASRTRTTESTHEARRVAAESLLRQTMFDLNTEFEFQVRRALRPYLATGAGTAPAPEGVAREELPRT